MSQQEYYDWLIANKGLDEGKVLPLGGYYTELTAKPEFRNLSVQERNALFQQLKDRRISYNKEFGGKRFESESGIQHVESDGWHHTRINGDPHTGTTRDKAYITLKDGDQIREQDFIGFARYLRDNGYQGQMKMPTDGWRMQSSFDNIVMHGATAEDRDLGLNLALKYFGKRVQNKQIGSDSKGKSHTQLLADQLEEALSKLAFKFGGQINYQHLRK